MVIDIRNLLLWKAEQDLFLAWINEKAYNVSQAQNRVTRIRQGIGFR